MKGWFTDRFFRTREHTAQVETVVSPSDCLDCIEFERKIRAERSNGNNDLAAALRVQRDIHCRKAHLRDVAR